MTSGRMLSVCGHMGVAMTASTCGATTGPPAYHSVKKRYLAPVNIVDGKRPAEYKGSRTRQVEHGELPGLKIQGLSQFKVELK